MPYSVPCRVGTLLHEFSHPFLNEDPDNESEADINGLLIYMGLGYPEYDAAEVWCRVFEESPSEENNERLFIIQQFIEDFRSNKLFIKQ